MTARMSIGVPIAVIITVILGLMMQRLIINQFDGPAEVTKGPVIEFIHVPDEPETRIKDNPLNRPKLKPQPPTPRIDGPSKKLPGDLVVMIPTINPEGPGVGRPGLNNREVLPIVQVPPDYPRRALDSGIEGWAQVRFSVSKLGTTYNAKVVDAEPRGYFEGASLRAIRKFKYNPKLVNGEPVEQDGIEYVFTFQMEK